MELLLSASLVAAFIAGAAALFAPCCITVLLPSYFASVFRERYRVFLMTFVFFFGVLAVFLPLGLGAAALGQLFSRYHNQIFIIGGIFMTSLGMSLLLGRHFSLPFKVNPVLKNNKAGSVFALGVFSGIATTCCAPVLAGVLALSVLPASVAWGGIYTLSYVLGMVAPLFFLAAIIDKTNFVQKIMNIRKPMEYKLGDKKVSVSITDVISGITFLGMGALIIFLAFSNRLFIHSQYQIDINVFVAKTSRFISQFIPNFIFILLLLILLLFIGKVAVKQIKK